MTWNRAALKAAGKETFRNQRGLCVKVTLIWTLLIMAAVVLYLFAYNADNQGKSDLFLILMLAYALFLCLALNPAEVGIQKFFLQNRRADGDLQDFTSVFHGNSYRQIVKTLFLRNLYLSLWCALFIVPGIVKLYSYRMIPYILAENPDISPKDAFTRSREMMNGQKRNAFLLDLSFIGWNALAVITCGIAGVFYTFPYQLATNAELYQTLNGEESHNLWLVCKGGPLAGGVYAITAARAVSIGRFSSNTVHFPIDFPGISREHAKIFWEDGVFMLTDCGSATGTFLNDNERLIPMQPREIRPGDTFYLGESQNLFEISV